MEFKIEDFTYEQAVELERRLMDEAERVEKMFHAGATGKEVTKYYRELRDGISKIRYVISVLKPQD